MAECKDNFSDLKELGIDCDSNESSDAFQKAANHVQTLAAKLDDQTLLSLYGLYKQSIEGSCTISKPSWFDFKGRSKWEAWKKLENMPKEVAQKNYISLVQNIDPNFNPTIKVTSDSNWVQVSIPMMETLDDKEKTIIDFIKEHNQSEVDAALTNRVARINDLDGNGMALIHWAADSGSTAILNSLIKAGADVNVKDFEGQTPLHYASSCGHVECVKLLVENGALVNFKDNDGMLPEDVTDDDAIKKLLSQKC